ncbi:octopamine receptor beta-3R [Biomphalaria glabrata]|nr:octopamine receptor beta-3R-like [Biomphalaria glabrata]
MLFNQTNCSMSHHARSGKPPITSNRNILVILTVLFCLVAVVTLFLNAIVIVAICKPSRKGQGPGHARRNGNNTQVVKLLMASMAAADAVVALVIMPLKITEMAHNGEWIFPKSMCKFRSLTSIYLCTVSVYHVMGMAIDRYLAICRPMSYRLLTIKTGCLMAGLFWTIPMVLYIIPIIAKWIIIVRSDTGCGHLRNNFCKAKMHDTYSVASAVLSFYIPFLMIFSLYSKVLLEVRKFHKGHHGTLSKSRSQKNVSLKSNSSENDSFNDNGQKESNPGSLRKCSGSSNISKKLSNIGKSSSREYRKPSSDLRLNYVGTSSFRKSGIRKKSTKALLTIGLIVITFTVTWLPFSVFKVVFGVSGHTPFPAWIYNVTIWMGYFNSTLNPILFCLHQGIRSSVKKLLFP